ncbi:hypothetical protein GE061_015229 [Apolygus lucorum]|uniref:Leucine-rich repeat-containing protein 27 n=1 Tax=Apolygus lucorum TaxID=248454 RepID=A0A8S9XKE1_APOLU|nr:hypothetical protein GE061_015229 [Apolygus lucorum]
MNGLVARSNVQRKLLDRSLHEELLFTPQMPTVEHISLKRIFLDARKRGLQIFNLANFLEPTKWSKLTHLYLARNFLMDLPEELFYQAENLEWLDVRWNELRTFPASVKEHPSLKTVLLQDNFLAKLPIEIGSLEHLQYLSVSNNPLEFPSPDTLSKCRANGDLIKYLKRCWNEQSADVPPLQQKEKLKRKRGPKKLAPLRKVKDHTEVICRLRNSGKIKDQIRGEKMLQMLEFEHKLVQSFKDQDVLKKWRDVYKESQGSSTRQDAKYPNLSSILFTNDTHEENWESQKDIDSAIDELQKELRQSGLSRLGSADPELIIREKSREINTMKNVQKKISYLKQRC